MSHQVNTAADEPALLVMDLKAESGVSESAGRLLNELILSEYQAVGRYRVTGGSDLQALITTEQHKQMLGCADDGCLVEIAGALDADYFAITSVGVIGEEYLVNAKIIAVRDAAVAARVTRKADADERELISAVEAAVRDVIAEAGRDAGGGGTPAVETGPSASSHALEWTGLSISSVAVAAGAVLLVVRTSRGTIEDQQYAAYTANPNDTTYAAVDDEVSKSNTMTVAGAVLVGAGAIGAALSLFGLLSDDDVIVSLAPAPAGATVTVGGAW